MLLYTNLCIIYYIEYQYNWPYIYYMFGVGHASNVWLDLDLLHSRIYIYIIIAVMFCHCGDSSWLFYFLHDLYKIIHSFANNVLHWFLNFIIIYNMHVCYFPNAYYIVHVKCIHEKLICCIIGHYTCTYVAIQFVSANLTPKGFIKTIHKVSV